MAGGGKFVYGLVTKEISAALAKRGFASSSASSSSSSSSSSQQAATLLLKNKTQESSKSWGPDPVTGYYRPGNHSTKEIDAVDLRRLLLNNNNNNSNNKTPTKH